MRRWLVNKGCKRVVAGQDLLQGDLLSSMSSNAPHGGGQAARRAALDFVVGLVVEKGKQAIVPLELLGIFFRLRKGPDHVAPADILSIKCFASTRRVGCGGDDAQAL